MNTTNEIKDPNGEAVDVLVVGAGPTGLMAAGELARRGVAVRVVEKAAERSPLSKALVVQARTLETMDLIGLSDEFVRRGYPVPGLNVGLGSGKKPISVEMQGLDTHFPYMLVLPQEETEKILEARLDEHGVAVERGVELVGVEQRDDSVVSTVRLPDGGEDRVRSRYLVGCDGAHSAVRRAIELPFEGKDSETVVFLADVKLDGEEFVKSRIVNFPSRRGFVAVLPFLGEYSRIFAFDFAKQHRTPTDELTLAELQDTVDAVVPTKLTLKEPRWITRFHAPSRQVATNRKGRVFLAGDAAHVHSPAGGQGMNTGLQDAFNLGWKLAMVLRGDASGELLGSYDAERHPVATRVQRGADLMFGSFIVRNPALKVARDLAARALVSLPPAHKRFAENLSGVAINYRFTAQSREDRHRGLPKGAVQAGDRVPDLELWDARQPSVRLHELLREPGYTLFAFVSATRLGAERESFATLVRSVNEGYGETVRPRVVLDEGVPEAAGAGTPALIDFKGEFRDKLGAGHGSVLLVRPDGYVAFHREGFDPRMLSAALASWVAEREKSGERNTGHEKRNGKGGPDALPGRVLLATDGKEDAALATQAAVDLAERTGSELHVVHAWHDVPTTRFHDFVETELERIGREVLDGQVEKLEKAGAKIAGAHLREGRAAEAVVRLAEEIGADYVVVGSRDLRPWGRLALGSVSEEIVHHARVPILVVPEAGWTTGAAPTPAAGDAAEVEGRPALVVATDGSYASRRAGEHAVYLAKRFGTRLLILYVVDEDLAFHQGIHYGEAMRELARDGREATGKIAALAREAGVEHEELLVEGRPERAIADVAERAEAEYVVVGSHGSSGLGRVVLGSVSEKVLHHAKRPVLVVGGDTKSLPALPAPRGRVGETGSADDKGLKVRRSSTIDGQGGT